MSFKTKICCRQERKKTVQPTFTQNLLIKWHLLECKVEKTELDLPTVSVDDGVVHVVCESNGCSAQHRAIAVASGQRPSVVSAYRGKARNTGGTPLACVTMTVVTPVVVDEVVIAVTAATTTAGVILMDMAYSFVRIVDHNISVV